MDGRDGGEEEKGGVGNSPTSPSSYTGDTFVVNILFSLEWS